MRAQRARIALPADDDEVVAVGPGAARAPEIVRRDPLKRFSGFGDKRAPPKQEGHVRQDFGAALGRDLRCMDADHRQRARRLLGRAQQAEGAVGELVGDDHQRARVRRRGRLQDGDQLARIFGDMASLAWKWNKPLSARLQPVKGKKAGDQTEFTDPYLFNTTVHAVP